MLGVEFWALRIATSRVVRSEEIGSAADPYNVSREGEPPTRRPSGGVNAVRVMRAGNALVSSTCSGCIAQEDLSLALEIPEKYVLGWSENQVAAQATLVRQVWCRPMLFIGGIMLKIV